MEKRKGKKKTVCWWGLTQTKQDSSAVMDCYSRNDNLLLIGRDCTIISSTVRQAQTLLGKCLAPDPTLKLFWLLYPTTIGSRFCLRFPTSASLGANTSANASLRDLHRPMPHAPSLPTEAFRPGTLRTVRSTPIYGETSSPLAAARLVISIDGLCG